MLINRQLSYVVGLVILGTIFLVCSSCSNNTHNQPTRDTEQVGSTPTPVVIRYSSQIIYRSYRELLQAVDIVVIARVKVKDRMINAARNTANPAEPSSREYGLGQVYRVAIEEYIKGSGPGEIFLMQGQGLIKIEGGTVNAAELEKIANQNQGSIYLPVQMDTPYLMFLVNSRTDYSKEGFELGSIYIGLHPWRFVLTDPERVTVEDEIADLATLFPPQPLASILEQIMQSESIENTPYP